MGLTREQRQAREAEKARMRQLAEAVADEQQRVNLAIFQGGAPVIDTAFGPYQVDAVDRQFWFHCHPAGKAPDSFNSRSFAGCNDRTWDEIMQQLKLPRHPMFV